MPPLSNSQHPSSNYQTERQLREEIVRIGKLLYDRGLIVATDGNISARLDDRRILATPSGLCKGLMTVDQLIIVDMDGKRIGPTTPANRDLTPTSEMRMHLEAYKRRPDVHAVVHAHPPTVVAASIAGLDLTQCLIPEVIVMLGLIPTTNYATPSSEENALAIQELITGHDAIILQRHGTLVVGQSPTDAFLKTETVDQMARVSMMLEVLGKGNALSPDQVSKLITQRQNLGLSRAGDEGDFCEYCNVCHLPNQHIAPIERPAITDQQIREITLRVLRDLGK